MEFTIHSRQVRILSEERKSEGFPGIFKPIRIMDPPVRRGKSHRRFFSSDLFVPMSQTTRYHFFNDKGYIPHHYIDNGPASHEFTWGITNLLRKGILNVDTNFTFLKDVEGFPTIKTNYTEISEENESDLLFILKHFGRSQYQRNIVSDKIGMMF